MRVIIKNICILIIFSLLLGQASDQPRFELKEFKPAGRIEALVENKQIGNSMILVQLDLKNDSLFNLVNDMLPKLELFSGPATYHRIVYLAHIEKIKKVLPDDFYIILNENYQLPSVSREYWVDFKQGGETLGTWSEDEAIEYTCACLNGASDCVKLGWDESWWNPLDYWGEVWYGYQPPYYQSIQEIRVTVRGAQCDDLPIWSETYMGMMDANGNWSQDYELSIDYTDNEYIVSNTWNGSMLMPRIGSEDNYCIDNIKLEFFYTCDEPESPTNLLASDEEDCYTVSLSWDGSASNINQQTLYRDNSVVAVLNTNDSDYEDWGAQSGIQHIYCIDVQNECGSSTMSCNPGSLKMEPNSPLNVIASDGEYTNTVLVSWSPVILADEYKIYRDGAWMGIVSDADNLEYNDIVPSIDTIHEYCIESINNCGVSDWRCDFGYITTLNGDVNTDGLLDILDIVMVISIIVENYFPSEDEIQAADMNIDSNIDILDIIILVNLIL